MTTKDGYIKFYRSILNWEWWHDISVFRLFVFLLLRANHKENKWKGITIGKGQLLTSRDELAKNTGLSVQQVRTAITKLKSTGEITIESTNKYTLISLVNYASFQSLDDESNQQNNQQSTKRATNNQPTNNQQITTNKNVKNNKKVYIPPFIPPQTEKPEKDIFQGRSFSDTIKPAIESWLKYKAERRDSYKPTGLKMLLSEIENKLTVYTESDVIKVMQHSMSNNWAGIAWEKLKGREKRGGQPIKAQTKLSREV